MFWINSMYVQYYTLIYLRHYSHKSMMLYTCILYWHYKHYWKYYTLYILPDIKSYVRRHYTIAFMSWNQLTHEYVSKWFLSPRAKASETMSIYFLLGFLTLLNLLGLVVSFCTGSRGLWTETLGMGSLLSPDTGGTMGWSLTRGCAWVMLDLHTLSRLRSTPCLLVGISCW